MIDIYWVMAVLSVAVTTALAVPRCRALRISGRRITILGMLTTFSVVLGARAAFVLMNFRYFRQHPERILHLDQGGFALFGGLLLVWAVVAIVLRRWKMPVRATVDRMIPPMVAGQAVIKVGCLLHGCCYGFFTDLPWGIRYPGETLRRHPTALYEIAALLGIYALMRAAERRGQGQAPNFLIYGLLYGLFRFATDFLRADSSPVWEGLKSSQGVALLLALVCGFLLFRRWISCTRS